MNSACVPVSRAAIQSRAPATVAKVGLATAAIHVSPSILNHTTLVVNVTRVVFAEGMKEVTFCARLSKKL